MCGQAVLERRITSSPGEPHGLGELKCHRTSTFKPSLKLLKLLISFV